MEGDEKMNSLIYGVFQESTGAESVKGISPEKAKSIIVRRAVIKAILQQVEHLAQRVVIRRELAENTTKPIEDAFHWGLELTNLFEESEKGSNK